MVARKEEEPDWELLVAIADARSAGVRIEMAAGVPTWELFPTARHQSALMRIWESVKRAPGARGDCGCYKFVDLLIRFPDESFKTPDLSVFCSPIKDEDRACRQIPEAVVEVLSLNYEAKDLEIGVPFYLAQGVKDVIVLDPRSGAVKHYVEKEVRELRSPVEITLCCGCVCTV